MSKMDDVLNGGGVGRLAEEMHPKDYVDGRGYSKHVTPGLQIVLDSMTGDEVDVAADDSWGFLKPECLAIDDLQFANMKLGGLL